MNPFHYYQDLDQHLIQLGQAEWAKDLLPQLESYFKNPGHGDYPQWLSALAQMPALQHRCNLEGNVPRFGEDPDDAVPLHQDDLSQALFKLRPWRKGPLDIGGVLIDSEWRCDWKWQRVQAHLSPLTGRHVLDVGAGNGYYSWRMLGAGAASVLAVDPSLLFTMQWLACRIYSGPVPMWLLPARLEDLPPDLACFDTVFSMGVLYHRRTPHEHLRQLLASLKPGGELVLETLVSMGEEDILLNEDQRYARMRNIWCIPRPRSVEQWLQEVGLEKVRLVDVAATTTAEQRSTNWMPFDSLAEGLAEDDVAHTVEGLPAPVRAVFIARKPDA